MLELWSIRMPDRERLLMFVGLLWCTDNKN